MAERGLRSAPLMVGVDQTQHETGDGTDGVEGALGGLDAVRGLLVSVRCGCGA